MWDKNNYLLNYPCKPIILSKNIKWNRRKNSCIVTVYQMNNMNVNLKEFVYRIVFLFTW